MDFFDYWTTPLLAIFYNKTLPTLLSPQHLSVKLATFCLAPNTNTLLHTLGHFFKTLIESTIHSRRKHWHHNVLDAKYMKNTVPRTRSIFKLYEFTMNMHYRHRTYQNTSGSLVFFPIASTENVWQNFHNGNMKLRLPVNIAIQDAGKILVTCVSTKPAWQVWKTMRFTIINILSFSYTCP